MAGETRRQHSLLPREHGAYAQLGFPLITALALGRPGAAALLLPVAVIAAFLLHEPVLVAMGARGARLKREAGSRALRRIVVLGVLALSAGAAGLILAPAAARVSALIPAGLAALFVPFIIARREKTAAGELLVAWSLSTTLIPVAVAAGVGLRTAVAAGAVWGTALSLITITVRAVIARNKAKPTTRRHWLFAPALCGLTVAAALVIALRGSLPAPVALAVVPTALVALGIGVVGVHPRNLKRVGWSFVASNVVVLAALLAGSA